jgi:hypothetical protein
MTDELFQAKAATKAVEIQTELTKLSELKTSQSNSDNSAVGFVGVEVTRLISKNLFQSLLTSAPTNYSGFSA